MTGRSSIGLPRRDVATRPDSSRQELLVVPAAGHRSPPPAVHDRAWVRTPVDRFILAALERRGLKPNPIADRRTSDPPRLLRPDGTAAVTRGDRRVRRTTRHPMPTNASSIACWRRPHHGERFAWHWMDVARFAESHGYEQDYDRPFAYHYRDFLIRAFNGDMPYDQFVHWQLAGDELAPDDPLAMAATGFLGAGAFPTQLTEAEFESARYNELDDMVATTGVGLPRASRSAAPDATITSTTRSRPKTITGWPPSSRRRSAARSRSRAGRRRQAGEGAGHGRGLPAHQAPRRRPRLPPLLPEDVLPAPRRRRPEGERGGAGRAPGPREPGRRTSRRWKVEPTAARRPAASYRRAALAAWLTDTEYGAGATRRARDRQPALAAPLRPGDRRHAQRFRRAGEPAVPPRAARLARRTP